MRIICTLLAVVAITAATVTAALAAPSFFGYTGLLLVPNADTLDARSFNVGYVGIDLPGNNLTNFFGNYGINGNIEIGINRERIKSEGSETLLNGKFRIADETAKKVGVAAGVIDASGEVERTLYVVGSKAIGRRIRAFDKEITNLRIHFGLASGGLDGILVGASAVLGNRLALLAEYDSDNFNAGARLYLTEGIRAHAAIFDVGADNDPGIGVSFSKNY